MQQVRCNTEANSNKLNKKPVLVTLYTIKRVKSEVLHKPRGLLFLSHSAEHQLMLQDKDLGLTHQVVITHCGYPQRDGQAELTWVTGHIHPVTIRFILHSPCSVY